MIHQYNEKYGHLDSGRLFLKDIDYEIKIREMAFGKQATHEGIYAGAGSMGFLGFGIAPSLAIGATVTLFCKANAFAEVKKRDENKSEDQKSTEMQIIYTTKQIKAAF